MNNFENMSLLSDKAKEGVSENRNEGLLEENDCSEDNDNKLTAVRKEDMVSDNELEIRFVRSGGPGGQNVNKVNTKAELHWVVDESKSFTDEEKEKIKEYFKNSMSQEGEIILRCSETRSALENQKRVVERLNEGIKKALQPNKPRIPTQPSNFEKAKRLEEKKKVSYKKQLRRKPFDYED